MAVGDAYVFLGFLTPVLTQLFFPKPPITFLTYFCRGERRKYAGKKSCLNRVSNSQPPGHESDTLTTETPGRGNDKKEKAFLKHCGKRRKCWSQAFSPFAHNVFIPSNGIFIICNHFPVEFQLLTIKQTHFTCLRYLSIIKSRSQFFRRSLKFHSKFKRLMTFSKHPGH